MHSWDQMKPRTVYEKAVQDFTETAQQLARLKPTLSAGIVRRVRNADEGR